MTDDDVREALDMGGSILTYDQAIASWGYNKGYGDTFSLDDLDTDSETRFLEAYDNDYFVCACCAWPFEIIEMADDCDEPTCESCSHEQ